MKITVFTSNQPRHISLIEDLSSIADEVYAIQECNTVFPGQIADFFKRTEIMQEYFSHVINAEREVFGYPRFLPANVKSLSIKSGDLNNLRLEDLKPALESDLYVVFGSSFIKGDLIEFLVKKRALNVHMGLSPFYRGSSCNFWALYDNNPDYVGATIHLLSKGLDSGPMLFHAVPTAKEVDAFSLGMHSVRSAHRGLIAKIKSNEIMDMTPVAQDKSHELRYSRAKDFNDEVASNYLNRMLSPKEIYNLLSSRQEDLLLRLHVGD